MKIIVQQQPYGGPHYYKWTAGVPVFGKKAEAIRLGTEAQAVLSQLEQ